MFHDLTVSHLFCISAFAVGLLKRSGMKTLHILCFCSFFLQVKVTQELKNTHTEQMTRLHFKHQTECDLLEDMRYEHVSETRI